MSCEQVEANLLAAWPANGAPSLLADLPADERRAFILSYFGGYDYRQVAELVDRSRAAVADDISASLRRLQNATDPERDWSPATDTDSPGAPPA